MIDFDFKIIMLSNIIFASVSLKMFNNENPNQESLHIDSDQYKSTFGAQIRQKLKCHGRNL